MAKKTIPQNDPASQTPSRTLTSLCAEYSALANEWMGPRANEIPLKRRHEMAERMIAIRHQAFFDFDVEELDIEVWAFEGKTESLQNERRRLINRRLNARDTKILARLEVLLRAADAGSSAAPSPKDGGR